MAMLIFHSGSALFSRITAKVIHYLCFCDSFHFPSDWIYQMEATGLHTHTRARANTAHFKFYLHSLNGLCHCMVPELMFNFSSFSTTQPHTSLLRIAIIKTRLRLWEISIYFYSLLCYKTSVACCMAQICLKDSAFKRLRSHFIAVNISHVVSNIWNKVHKGSVFVHYSFSHHAFSIAWMLRI